MSRDLTSMDDRSLVTMLSAQAIGLGQMKASPNDFDGDQERVARHISAIEQELISRLRTPVIV